MLIVSAIMLLGLQSANADYYPGTLTVEKPIEIKIKSKKIALDPGVYEAVLQKNTKAGLFSTKRFLNYKIQTSAGVLEGDLKYEKKQSSLLQDQTFYTEDASTASEKIVSDNITEKRVCVVQSFSTQENCRITYDYVCHGGSFNGECSGGWESVPSVTCDTVYHEIKGVQDVTFQKKVTTYYNKLLLRNKADKAIIANLVVKPKPYDGEKRISETPCK